MDYIIASNTNFLDNLIKLTSDEIHLLTHQELREKQIPLSLANKIYAPHEDALDNILLQSTDAQLADGIIQLKDKFLFRQLLKKVTPDYFCKVVNREKLTALQLPTDRKYVLKPRKGFFGTAVHFIDHTTDLQVLSLTIEAELKKSGSYFSNNTLDTQDLIVEEFIEGEEYAVDMFFNSNGEPVITNITHHPLAHRQEYFHSLYYTSREVFEQYYDRFITFFNHFNQELKLRNFPIHAEFKGTPENFKSIEMNPLRFGGFGLADLAFHTTGLNPFKAYFLNESIDWSEFWQQHPDESYCWVLGYKGAEAIFPAMIPDHQAFQQYLGEIIHYTVVDHLTNPVFAIAYIKVNGSSRIDEIKDTEFNHFFILQ
ncbi:MAG: ATP-grasp domain-containing protein [Endozoicomonadaceae bacterium]|nr:ATP-grasp domain-containing protein [Endozoicomonadaceae bacterium]